MTQGTPSEPTTQSAGGGKISRRTALGLGALGAVVVAGGVTLAVNMNGAGARNADKAKTLITGGKVWTGDPKRTAEAVAIAADGTILAVGSIADLKAFSDHNTEVIDAKGGFVMPGIHDGHLHSLGGAESALSPSLDNATGTVDELLAYLTQVIENDAEDPADPNSWLRVADWNPTGLVGAVAHRKFLDTLPTKRPIFLQGSDFHNGWANSRALELAGVDANTPNPTGGEIVMDADGPTGLFKDNAQVLVQSAMPKHTEEQLARAYTASYAKLAANGITSFMEASGDDKAAKRLTGLINDGTVNQRVSFAYRIPAELAEVPTEAVETIQASQKRYADVDRFTMRTIKVMMDGVAEYPALTAAMVEPYQNPDGTPMDQSGALYFAPELFNDLAVAVDAAGWQIHTHAIGDLAVRTTLDGFEQARTKNGKRDSRHTIAHIQFVAPEDRPRFAELGALASMQLQWAVQDTFTIDALAPYVGPERHLGTYPAGSLQDAGAHLVGGSDWPIDPLSPWNQIQTAVDRVGLGSETGEPLYAEQGLSLTESLEMHTRGGAFQLFQEKETGRIAPGMRADLVILDRDLLGVPLAEVSGATVKYTMVDGKVIHEAGAGDAPSANGAGSAAGAISLAGLNRNHESCGHPTHTTQA